jgi:hypothetical protein
MALVLAGITAILVSISVSDGGCLWHPGFKLFGQSVAVLCRDMDRNPGRYSILPFELESPEVVIWIANGWPAYRDYPRTFHPASHKVGSFSLADRIVFRAALCRLRAAKDAECGSKLISAISKASE